MSYFSIIVPAHVSVCMCGAYICVYVCAGSHEHVQKSEENISSVFLCDSPLKLLETGSFLNLEFATFWLGCHSASHSGSLIPHHNSGVRHTRPGFLHDFWESEHRLPCLYSKLSYSQSHLRSPSLKIALAQQLRLLATLS